MKDYKANNGKKKIYAIAICLLLTVVFAVGGTVAYLLGGRKNMEKELRSRTVKTRSVIWN